MKNVWFENSLRSHWWLIEDLDLLNLIDSSNYTPLKQLFSHDNFFTTPQNVEYRSENLPIQNQSQTSIAQDQILEH